MIGLVWFGLVWLLRLMAYQLLLGYLMPEQWDRNEESTAKIPATRVYGLLVRCSNSGCSDSKVFLNYFLSMKKNKTKKYRSVFK